MRSKNQSQILKTINLISRYLRRTKAVVSHRNPFRVLISIVISQRTKDKTTERVSRKLFSRYKTAGQLSKAPVKEIEKLIYGSGFHRNKARTIKKISQILVEKYKGKVPQDLDSLLALPGVGRKTANCTLIYAFNCPALCIDIHAHRIPNRLCWVKTKTPEQTERALEELIPKNRWLSLNELFVKFGQRCCKPVKPLCYRCPITKYCKYPKKTQNRRK